MILDQIYKDFLEHTGLTDSVYKGVFLKVQDTFDRMNALKFLSFYYRFGKDSLSIDFQTSTDPVPIYVVDIIDNLFSKSYTFPAESECRVKVLFQGAVSEIVSKGNTVEIPVELHFLETMNLFPFFCGIKCKNTYFEEFEHLFKFLEMKQPLRTVYSPLRQLFEKDVAQKKIDTKEVTASSSVTYSIIVEDLLAQKDQLVKKIDALKAKREELSEKKNKFIALARFKDSYTSEYSSLMEEYKTLQESKAEVESRIKSIADVLVEIDDKLHAGEGGEEDLTYFKNKKVFLIDKKGLLDSHLQQILSLLNTTKLRIEELKKSFDEFDQLSGVDINTIQDLIQNYNKDLEVMYHDLNALETSIANAKKQAVDIENQQILASSQVDTTTAHTIPTHLSKPDIPTSVTVVKNYLRYYFVYYSEKLGKEALKNPILEGTRCVLSSYFGFDPEVYFSTIPLTYFKKVFLVRG